MRRPLENKDLFNNKIFHYPRYMWFTNQDLDDKESFDKIADEFLNFIKIKKS